MLILHPADVTLLGAPLPGVESISVSREAVRFVTERTDAGPHTVFADAPEQAVEITILRAIEGQQPPGPIPGQQGALLFTGALSGADGPARRISATVVVRSARIELSRRKGAGQRIDLLALSTDGAADPITVQEVNP